MSMIYGARLCNDSVMCGLRNIPCKSLTPLKTSGNSSIIEYISHLTFSTYDLYHEKVCMSVFTMMPHL